MRLHGSPAGIGVCTGIVVFTFSALRFAVAAHHNVASFINVGSMYAHRASLPRGVPVFPMAGYDGQFYYRLALDPLAWGHQAFGISFDAIYRVQRIGYPALAWLAAVGHPALVPATLVLVNVVALGLLGGLGAALARDAGRAPGWGVVFAGFWGLLWSLSRDLTEIVTAVGVVGGLLALRRGRPVLAGLAFSLAVLSRESALVLVAALCLARVIDWGGALLGTQPRRRTLPNEWGRFGPSRLDLAWVLPLFASIAWQAVIWAQTGSVPLLAARGANSGVPFVGAARGIAHYAALLPATSSLLWFGEFALLIIIGIDAALSYRSTVALLHERLAWIGYGILAISLAPGIWLGDVGFRSFDEFYIFSWMLILCSRRPLRVPTAMVGLAWLGVAVELVLYI